MTALPPRMTSVSPNQRLESLDLLRGFALCGILLVNIMMMGGLWGQYHPELPPTLANPDWSAWIIQHLFVQGSMRGLFTLLFGAGMLLITLRGEDGRGTIQAADVYFRRCMALLALGVFNATVLLFSAAHADRPVGRSASAVDARVGRGRRLSGHGGATRR